MDPNGKFTEPGWWIEKDGKKGPESSIGADLFSILENLLILAEEMIVFWAADNLRFPASYANCVGDHLRPHAPASVHSLREL